MVCVCGQLVWPLLPSLRTSWLPYQSKGRGESVGGVSYQSKGRDESVGGVSYNTIIVQFHCLVVHPLPGVLS